MGILGADGGVDRKKVFWGVDFSHWENNKNEWGEPESNGVFVFHPGFLACVCCVQARKNVVFF